ncbi:MAG TPA: hypothetical protein ENN12_05655 [Epsilonproteobacteria bacterium]|nr:hypothetical protein [Campylobacterota bacterium]
MNNITQREQTIKSGLLAQQRMVKSLLGDKAKADKFLATAAKVATDYKLSNCNPQSIIDACIQVAQLNLDLSPSLAQAYLVPFKTKNGGKNVQLIVSKNGYIVLLDRAGWKTKSFIVREDDYFSYKINGFEEKIEFERNLDATDESFKYAVAMAKSPDGEIFIEIMNKAQIEKHRLVSNNQKGEPSDVWAQWYEEMAIKTVFKKLAKKLPLGEEVATAISVDDKVIEVTPEEKPNEDLNKMLEQPKEEKKEVVDQETGEVKQQTSLLDNTEEIPV